MNAWMAFVSIISIVAIILVVGGIIAVIGHVIVGAFDNDNKKPKKTTDENLLNYQEYKQLNQVNTAENKVEPDLTQDTDYNFEEINKAKAQEEKLQAEQQVEDLEISPVDEVEESTDTKTESNLNNEENAEDNIDIDSLLDEISTEILDEEKEKAIENNAPEMSDELKAYDINKILAEDQIEDEETQEDSTDFEQETENQQVEMEQEDLDENFESLNLEEKEQADHEELTAAQKEIESLKKQLEILNKKLEEKPESSVEVVTIDMTEDECIARLEMLEERLKNVKKDYKINMKEYRPLKKVMNDLERYQTKLRRKDAVVAKKKVALYGVNNYVDIDKEKAEKLANEIELLDGLRLSVSHCEEVIRANQDRFPILEHTNKILEDQIANIEADIQATQNTLQKIREKKGEENNGENNQ